MSLYSIITTMSCIIIIMMSRHKPVRIKLFRVLPVEWAVVEHTDGDSNDCSFGNSDSIDDCCLLAVAISSNNIIIMAVIFKF